jgi:hypothetical protein
VNGEGNGALDRLPSFFRQRVLGAGSWEGWTTWRSTIDAVGLYAYAYAYSPAHKGIASNPNTALHMHFITESTKEPFVGYAYILHVFGWRPRDQVWERYGLLPCELRASGAPITLEPPIHPAATSHRRGWQQQGRRPQYGSSIWSWNQKSGQALSERWAEKVAAIKQRVPVWVIFCSILRGETPNSTMADGGGPGQLSVVLFYKYCGIGASADAVHAWQSAL